MNGSLIRNRNFSLLWAAQILSAIGNPFTALATAWIVYSITGSKIALGGVFLANTIPLVIGRLFAGPLVDRWDRKKVMLYTGIIRSLTLLLPVVLFSIGSLEIWHLYIVNMILGMCESFFQPAAFAILASLIPSSQLVKANGYLNASAMGSLLVGPALAGILVSVIAAPMVLLIDAIGFGVSAIVVSLLPSNKPKQVLQKSFVQDFLEGFSFFRENHSLLWLLGLAATANTGLGMILTLLLPMSIELLNAGPAGYGFLETAAGVGMLIGSLFASLLSRFPRRLVMIHAHIVGGIFIAINYFSYHLWFSCLLIVGYGIAIAMWNTYSGATYHELVPDRLRGRVQSVRLLIAQGTTPLGMALGAVIAQLIGLRGIILAVGGMIIVTGFVALMIPSIKTIDRVLLKRKENEATV